MPKKITTKDYIDRCKAKGYDLPIEGYKGSIIKIKHKCIMGHIYEQSPSNHLSGHGCPKCSDSEKKSHQKYYNECIERGLDLPIEDYINARTKIKHKCSKGHVYCQVPYAHLSGSGCPICITTKVHNNQRKNPLQYISECESKGYDLPIEDYINKKTKIKHRCNNCGNIYAQTPSNHLRGQGCPKCGTNKSHNKQRKSKEKYHNECKEKGLDLPIEPYVNATTKINHMCNKNHIYNQTPHNHLQGYGCPVCSESHGEKYVRNYLDKNNINYISQKRFHDLKDKTYLSYDFYLPEYNMLIEYQGIQHYESIKFNGKNKSNLEKQQEHDNLKRKYAKDNGYKLLELKYTLNTQELVDKYLSRRIKD